MRRIAAAVTCCALVASAGCTRRTYVASFPIDGHPSAVAVVGERVWVSDDANHSIHVLDARTGDAARPPIEVSRNPVALATGGGALWVAHADGHLTAIDVRTSDVRRHRVGGSLTGVVYANGAAWLTDLEHRRLVEVDPGTLHVRNRIDVPRGAIRVAAGPGRSLWVTNDEDTVSVVANGRVREVRRVGTAPIGLASDGRSVWVADSEDDTVTAFRGANASEPERISVGRAPVAVAVVGNDAWSANQDAGTLTALARPDGRPIELGTHPRGAVGVEWFGHREIWVVGSNPDAVVRVQL